ncbi:MAG: hypothetical protein F6K48_03405 [Okeania sp. SIO3H1]|nr:hypothetical protein [Okeania sp. SIO3H1]
MNPVELPKACDMRKVSEAHNPHIEKSEERLKFLHETLPLLIMQKAGEGKRLLMLNFDQREPHLGDFNGCEVYYHRLDAIQPITSLLHPAGYIVDIAWDEHMIVVRW